MSEGIGKNQKQIIELCRSAEVPLTSDRLKWSIVESELAAGPEGKSVAFLESAYKSFRRSLNRLTEDNKISIEKRKLVSLGEVIEHFPDRTNSPEIRALRRTFLPALLEWVNDPLGTGPQYAEGENERFFSVKLTPERLNELREQWFFLERGIRLAFAESGSKDLLKLICKARFLFDGFQIGAAGSFRHAAIQAIQKSALPRHLKTGLSVFLEDFLPRAEADTLLLKSYIHGFAQVPNRSEMRLKPESLMQLYKRRQMDSEKLEGFEPPKTAIHGWGRFIEPPKFPSSIHKILDKNVFSKFEFISIPGHPRPST